MDTKKQKEILDRLPKWARELIQIEEDIQKEKFESEKKQSK